MSLMGGFVVRVLQLFGLVVVATLVGLAAGIFFVYACAATLGDGSQPGAPAWLANLADLFWLPPLLGVVLAAIGLVVFWRSRRNR